MNEAALTLDHDSVERAGDIAEVPISIVRAAGVGPEGGTLVAYGDEFLQAGMRLQVDAPALVAHCVEKVAREMLINVVDTAITPIIDDLRR